MTIHRVTQGECLSSIAASHGFADWRTIYDHPENAGLREKRPNPNTIYPGDRIFIPDRASKYEAAQTESRHLFKRHGAKVLLRLALLDEDGEALANKRYVLTVDEETFEDYTDGEGGLEQEIPADIGAGELTVLQEEGEGEDTGESYTWALEIGGLDPIDQVEGIQARLNNLGFESGSVDGIRGPRTAAAVRRFQQEQELDVDGIPGPLTQTRLAEVHGS